MCFPSKIFQPLERVHSIRQWRVGAEGPRYSTGRLQWVWVWLRPVHTWQHGCGMKGSAEWHLGRRKKEAEVQSSLTVSPRADLLPVSCFKF